MNRRRKSKSESSKLPDVVMTIEVPKALEGAVFVASVSGGKDSAAVVQALREAGIPFVAAFADTGWEAPATYEYLETMERVFGITIHRVRAEGGGMVEKIMARAGFPARKQRWCTRELKIQPLTEFCQRLAAEQGREVVQVLGIRKEESEKRSMALPVEHDDSRDLWVWRPILDWTVGDVLAAHHRAGLPVNPLYKQGHNRVGCWPCIYAGKEEIRLIAEQDPGRIAQIAQLERDCERLRAERNIEQPDRYAHEMASFFQARQAIRVKGRRVYLPMHIEQIVEWSRTDHGGKQHLLVREAPDGGCFRWGTCEPPQRAPAPEPESNEASGEVLVMDLDVLPVAVAVVSPDGYSLTSGGVELAESTWVGTDLGSGRVVLDTIGGEAHLVGWLDEGDESKARPLLEMPSGVTITPKTSAWRMEVADPKTGTVR